MNTKLVVKLVNIARSQKLTPMQREQVLDCMVCAVDNVHPDNWVEDVGDCEEDPDTPYGYNSTTDLDWLREQGIIR